MLIAGLEPVTHVGWQHIDLVHDSTDRRQSLRQNKPPAATRARDKMKTNIRIWVRLLIWTWSKTDSAMTIFFSCPV
jgi:hypothetical protein